MVRFSAVQSGVNQTSTLPPLPLRQVAERPSDARAVAERGQKSVVGKLSAKAVAETLKSCFVSNYSMHWGHEGVIANGDSSQREQMQKARTCDAGATQR